MEGRPQGETGPRNYLRPGIPSIQSGPGGPQSSHVPDRRVSLYTEVFLNSTIFETALSGRAPAFSSALAECLIRV